MKIDILYYESSFKLIMENFMNIAIITAAGNGKRMNSNKAKQYLEIKGYPILYYTIKKFYDLSQIDQIILVVPKNDIEYVQKKIVEYYGFTSKISVIIAGGTERQDSIFNALNHLKSQNISINDKILIHDGVRPFINQEVIVKSLKTISKDFGIVVGVAVKDTIKEIDKNSMYQKTLDRSKLVSVQTPQGFLFSTLYSAYKEAKQNNFYSTDDAALVEKYGKCQIKMIQGDYFNIKITTTEDLIFAKAILEK